ncbi:MAG TPA: helix-hairpin-helix domain-containing protein [Chloroflexota bacterium]|jgi:DNA polymerase (family 10)|nr:helix-hairpin-helix domain-containing protein [Chloroflexota bacterium]
MENRAAARQIFEIASLLETQGANPYRVRAYRRAALGLLYLPTRADQYTTETGELDLPWLGQRLRRKLGELVTRGRMDSRENLVAQFPRAFRELLSVPGIGPKTATRLIEDLGIRSVAGLARAARAHRLRQVYWIGPERERRLGLAAEAQLKQAAA